MYYHGVMAIHVVPVRDLTRTRALCWRACRLVRLLITVSGRAVARLLPIEQSRTFFDQLVAEGRAVAPTDESAFPLPVDLGGPPDLGALMAADRAEQRW